MRFNLTSSHTGNKPSGFTVVELMIAIAIASILMLGVIQTFVMSKHTYKLSDAMARAQENARYAVNYLSREIRMAGYVGCRTTNIADILNNNTYWMYDFNTPIQGWEGGVSTFPTEFAANVIPGTDAFVVLRGGDSQYQMTQYPAANSASFKLNTTVGLAQYDVVIASDCNQATIFQITKAITNNNVVHNTGNVSSGPGNCTDRMGSPVPAGCNSPSQGQPYNYGMTTTMLRMTSTAYYIGQSNSGSGHALFRMAMDKGEAGNPEELADGIEDMQVLYGVDTNGDGLANQYITADQVPGTPNGWQGVVSVRLGLLVDTVTNNVIKSKDNANYTIAGTQIIAATPGTGAHEHPIDNKLRFPITTTIKIRNR